MNQISRLITISGPLKGQSFQIDHDEISLGRGSVCTIRIQDSAISRKHCVIQTHGNSHKIIDLTSLNGTFVNGIPINEQILQDGSQIELGESTFVYIKSGGEIHDQEGEVKMSSELFLNSTLELLPSDTMFLNPQASRSRTKGSALELLSLLNILTSIQNIAEPQELYEKLAALLPAVVPLRCCTILLCEPGTTHVYSAASFSGDALNGQKIVVSSDIVQRVLTEGVALLCDPASRKSESGSVICVPLSSFQEKFGVLYVEAREQFHAKHLELLTAVGNICAVTLHHAKKIETLESKTLLLEGELNARQTLVGSSSVIRHVHQMIARVAPTDSTVMVLGETGTGKEVVASAIHRNSRRAKHAFVAINCAAIPESLMESELFGYTKGAFTGAMKDKKGKIEIANAGTLFLDEVADLSPMLQAKLLRVIQERELERLGSSQTIPIDIRLIAATNRDLKRAIERGKFREDLYHRLNVFVIDLPPLRQRREDIPILANHFLTGLRQKLQKEVSSISGPATTALINYDWPGNVRELENTIERALIMATTPAISAQDLPEFVVSGAPADLRLNYQSAVDRAKRQAILIALKKSGGNYTKAAELLGLQRTYLHQLIRKLKIKHSIKS